MTHFDAPGPVPPPPPPQQQQPPGTPAAPVLPYMGAPTPEQLNTRTIHLFRQQIHAVGGLWIIFGGLAVGVGLYFLNEQVQSARASGAGIVGPGNLVVGVLLAIGALWVVVGVFACMKQMWA